MPLNHYKQRKEILLRQKIGIEIQSMHDNKQTCGEYRSEKYRKTNGSRIKLIFSKTFIEKTLNCIGKKQTSDRRSNYDHQQGT